MNDDTHQAQIVPRQDTAPAEWQDFSPEQVRLIKTMICPPDTTDDELQFFIASCRRYRVDPFKRQVYALKQWDSTKRCEVLRLQMGIDGLLVRAQETGKYRGIEGPFWCGLDGVWRDIWLSDDPPAASKVGVYIAGINAPTWGKAKYSEFVQTKKDGQPNSMWAKMPSNQLKKCALAQALRTALPDEVGGIYTIEELPDRSAIGEPGPTAAKELIASRAASTAPAAATINDAQRKRLWAVATENHGKDKKEAVRAVLADFGCRDADGKPSTHAITVEQYEDVVAAVIAHGIGEKKEPPPTDDTESTEADRAGTDAIFDEVCKATGLEPAELHEWRQTVYGPGTLSDGNKRELLATLAAALRDPDGFVTSVRAAVDDADQHKGDTQEMFEE